MCKEEIPMLIRGQQVSLFEMLAARENRVKIQSELLQQQSSSSLLCATMNIPGPVKMNEIIEDVFQEMREVIQQKVKDAQIYQSIYLPLKTGPEYYLLTNLNPMELKRRMVEIEETHPCGRIFDLDVAGVISGEVKNFSRRELNLLPRRCLLCDQSAKECGRTRRHDLLELQQEIIKIIKKGSDRSHD